jgi:hypothetical protein
MVRAPILRAFAAVLPMVLAACGSAAAGHAPSSSPASSPQPTVATSPASAAPPAGTAAAVAAYTAMWQAMQSAGTTSDWKDPALAAHAGGAALATLTAGLHNASRQGMVIRGTLAIAPSVTGTVPAGSVSPRQVDITDCLNDTHWLTYVRATGKLQNNVPGGHRLVTAVVTRQADGRWLVTTLIVHGEGTC